MCEYKHKVLTHIFFQMWIYVNLGLCGDICISSHINTSPQDMKYETELKNSRRKKQKINMRKKSWRCEEVFGPLRKRNTPFSFLES